MRVKISPILISSMIIKVLPHT